MYHTISGGHHFLPPPTHSQKRIINHAVADHPGPAFVRCFFNEIGRPHIPLRIALGDLLSQGQQHPGNVYINRTGVLTGAAERFSQKQILGAVDADQKGCDDGTHRTGVSKSIGMPADFSVYRAYVQAGGAPDATQHLAEFFVCQYLGAPVVDDDEMKFFGAINLIR